jgi:hypothetical protein
MDTVTRLDPLKTCHTLDLNLSCVRAHSLSVPGGRDREVLAVARLAHAAATIRPFGPGWL